MRFKDYLDSKKRLIDKALDSELPKSTEYPQVIHKAMRYAVSGGKRIRPILTIASSQACGGKPNDALSVACAVELVHTFSLIHDDLPAIDNDDYRRNRPTVHKKFSEAVAILAGDALLNLSFSLLTKVKNKTRQTEIIKLVSEAAGTYGLIGGEVMDIITEELSLPELEYVASHKTGALIAASVKAGAIAAGAGGKKINVLFKFGQHIGFAFQIVDDILDTNGYAKLLGKNASYLNAARLIDIAKGSLDMFGTKAGRLKQIADFVLTRKY